MLNRDVYRTEGEWLGQPTEGELLGQPTEGELPENPKEGEWPEHSKAAESLEHPEAVDRLENSETAREKRRLILISLRTDNIADYEKRSALSVLDEIEALDEAYYASYPSFQELADRYGDPKGEKLYSYRDLFAWYRKRYADEYGVTVFDVTDETRSGSRRY